MRDIIDLTGRIFLSAIFLFEAIDSALYFDKTKETMTQYGLTWNQDMLLYGAIIFLTLGGIMVLLGYRTTLGVTMLLIYWAPVTFLVHDVAIMGGLLMLAGKGSGRYSIKRLLATTKVSNW
jgi:putative oxidoreductase